MCDSSRRWVTGFLKLRRSQSVRCRSQNLRCSFFKYPAFPLQQDATSFEVCSIKQFVEPGEMLTALQSEPEIRLHPTHNSLQDYLQKYIWSKYSMQIKYTSWSAALADLFTTMAAGDMSYSYYLFIQDLLIMLIFNILQTYLVSAFYYNVVGFIFHGIWLCKESPVILATSTATSFIPHLICS